MKTDVPALLAALEDAVPAALERAGATHKGCILHTRVGVNLLREFGVRARPIVCQLSAFNAPFRERVERGEEPTPETSQEWQDDNAYAVQIGFGKMGAEDRYDGHVVALVENRWLLDLSLHQAARPTRDMFLSPTHWELPDPREFLAGEPVPVEQDTCLIWYRAQPERDDFYALPGWVDVPPGDHVCRRVAGELRKRGVGKAR